jgi:hypothetical protein
MEFMLFMIHTLDVGPVRYFIVNMINLGADIDKLEVFTYLPIALEPSTDWL